MNCDIGKYEERAMNSVKYIYKGEDKKRWSKKRGK